MKHCSTCSCPPYQAPEPPSCPTHGAFIGQADCVHCRDLKPVQTWPTPQPALAHPWTSPDGGSAITCDPRDLSIRMRFEREQEYQQMCALIEGSSQPPPAEHPNSVNTIGVVRPPPAAPGFVAEEDC